MKYAKFLSLFICFVGLIFPNSSHSEFINKGSFLINMDGSKLIYEITISTDTGNINDLDRKRSHRRRRIIRKPTRGRNPK